MYEQLFSSLQIRGLTLRNRVLMPAMATKMVEYGGFVSQQLIDYHVARTYGGNGLNILEATSVHAPSAPRNFLSAAEDRFIPGLRQMADAIHEAGGKCAVQLWQGGMVAASDPEAQLVMPSEMILGPGSVIPAASVQTILDCIDAFGQAARRCVEAGYDTVEFHAAHNYSPHSFLSAAFNKRTDQYGGSLENRARYPLACIRAIRENIPADMPLFMRIDAHDYITDGLTIEDIIIFCNWAREAGVDVLDVSRGNVVSAAMKFEVPSVDLPRGFNVENAARIRTATGMITVAVGRINDPAQAEAILVEGKADMVAVGRGQIADPEFCNKSESGYAEEIVKCIGCNQGCFDFYVSPEHPHISCTRNPAVGREKEFELHQPIIPKKVLIAGGGVAGMEAASVLHERGHNPVIYEIEDMLGGQFLLAGAAPRKQEMSAAAQWMAARVYRKGIEVHLSHAVTPEVMREVNPDEVIVAIGATPILLNIKGNNTFNVVNSHEVLSGRVRLGGDVVILGGGLLGLEVAQYLLDKVATITVVEMLNEVAGNLGKLHRISVMEEIAHTQIRLLTGAVCREITPFMVKVEKDGALQEIPCTVVVMAVGARSNNSSEIVATAAEMGIPCHVIGDALQARRALNAISEAAELARAI